MQTNTWNYSVAEYCRQIDDDVIAVDTSYQRGSGVWPDAARSFLIETILLDYPIPKLSLHEVTDVKSRRAVKYVVDGQQRTNAIKDYFDNKLRLGRTLDLEEARGCRYDDLTAELQDRFLSYSLGFDVFAGVEASDIREVFRRINSFTVPLNPEEQRHALRQGPFKWFIYRLSRDYEPLLLETGTFTTRQVVRMADAKLLTELAHALLEGVQTTNRTKLDRLYRTHDRDFVEERDVDSAIRGGLEQAAALDGVQDSYLARPHMFYALVLAVIYLRDSPASLSEVEPLDVPDVWTGSRGRNLGLLADAVELGEEASREFAGFVQASESRTNVREQRLQRARWFAAALSA
jgi:hypothetical protein